MIFLSMLLSFSFVLMEGKGCHCFIVSTFHKDVICKVSERIDKGCSLEVAGVLSSIQCVSLCGRNESCIGASRDGKGACYHHYECQDIMFSLCTNDDTNHHFMSRYCGQVNWAATTNICTHCISPCHVRTCKQWRDRGVTKDTYVVIDPDGPVADTHDPEVVYCHMTSHGGVGTTVIGHNMLQRKHVTGFESPGEFHAVLAYNTSFQQAIALVDNSQSCSQYMRWECHGSLVYNAIEKCFITGWLNRTKGLADYFAGGTPGSYNCACGMTGTCEGGPTDHCNCDANEEIWLKDDGYLTYKDDLPVFAVVAGDTGSVEEEGYFVVGPLECWGST